MISRKLFLKKLLSETIEPAILVVDEKLNIKYHSSNTLQYIKLPKTFATLKQLETLNKIAFTSIAKKAIQSIKSYADINISENLTLKNKSNSINLKIQKLQTEPIKEVLFSISISKSNSVEISPFNHHLLNDKKSKIKQVSILERKLNSTLTELNLLKKEHKRLKIDFETTHKNLEHVKTEYDINLKEQYELNFFMTQMLKNSNVATVFLNLDLQIIKYTPLLSKLFDVENRDVGRKITDFNHVFINDDWIALLHKANKNGKKIKAELSAKNDQHYLLMINPVKFSHVTTNVLSVSFVSITSQVKANQAKVASELKFRTLFESAVDGMAIIDLDKGSIVTCNKKMPKMFGITKEVYLTTNPYNFFPEFQSDGTQSKDLIKKLHHTLHQKGRASLVLEHKHKTKGNFFARLSKYKIPSSKQNYAAVVLQNIDKEISAIEALKKSEQQLKEVESRFRSLFEHAIDGIVVFDLIQQKVVEVNNSLVKMCGFSKKEIVDKAPSGMITQFLEDGQPSIQKYHQMVQLLKTQNNASGSFIHLHKNKQPFHVKVSLFKLPKPNNHLAVTVIKNIDAQKKAEVKSTLHLSQLKASESRHKAFFNQSLDGHVILNLEDMLPVEVNKRMLQMLRISKTEYFANPFDLFDAENNPTQLEKMFQELRAGLEKNKTFETEFYIKSSKRKSFLVKVLLHKLSAPNQQLAYAVIKDIDKERKAEEAATKHLTALTVSESRHKTFFNQSLDAHIILNKENMLPVEVNQRTLKLLRISKTGFFNTELYDFCDSDKNKISQSLFFEAIQASLMKNAPYEAEMYMKSSKRKSFLAKLLINQMPAPNEHLLYAVIKDIDDEHKAKEAASIHLKALAESESMFRTFFENGLDGFTIAQLFPKPTIIDVNSRMCELFGLSKKEFITSNIQDLLNPAQSNKKKGREVFDEITKSLTKKGFYRGEVVYVHKKNGPFYTNITMVRLKPPNDNKIFIQIANKDKEVKALQQVAKSEALFKSIFANSLDGIVIYNMDTLEAIDCNERVLEMTNCSRNKFKKALTKDFLPEKQANGKDSLFTFKQYLKSVSENKSINKEWLFKRYNSNELVYARISIIKLPAPFKKLAAISIADVTERKLAENAIVEKNKTIELTNEKLNLSLQKFKDTFNNSTNFIGRINLKGEIVEHNLTVYNNLIDQSNSTTNILTWKFPWFKNDRNTQKIVKKDVELAKKGIVTKNQVPYEVSPNFSGILEYTFTPLKNEKGEITEILAEGFDVTEQVNTLKRLEVNEQKFRAIYNNSSNFIGIFNIRGILLDHNQTVSDKLGNNEAQSVGMPLWDFPWFTKHKKSQQEYKRAVKKASTGKVATGTVQYSTSPEFTGTMKYDISPIFDEKGKVIWLLGEGKDLTEIINTHKELAFKEQKFRAIFNNSSNFIGLYRTDGSIEELNQPTLNQIKKNLKPTDEEYVLKFKIWDIPWVADLKESRQAFKASFKKVLKGKIDKGIIQYVPIENQIGILEYTLSPVFDENNNVLKVLGEAKDITEKLEVQKEIEASEKKFRDLFYNAKNRVVRLSPSGKVIAHNKIHRGRKNYATTKNYIGKYLWDFLTDGTAETSYAQIKQDFEKAANGELISGTISIINYKNKKIQLSYSLKPVFGVDKKVDWILGESNDITAITNTQKQLLENEQKFKAIFYNSENYIIRLDAKGNVLEHSRMHPDNSSYNLVKKNIGEALWEFPGITDYPISAQQLKKDIQKCAKGSFVSNQMLMLVRKTDGRKSQPGYKTGLVTYSLTPVFDENQKVDWILVEAKNITELDDAQKQLSISLRKYQKLFENNLVGIIILDENLKIIECNKAYKKITGYSLNEAEVFDYYNLIDKNEIVEAKLNEQKIRSTKVESLQFKRTIIKKNGERIILNIYLKPIYVNNQYKSAIVTIADITELENKRKALKEREQLYKAVFEGVNDGLYVYDYKKHEIVTFNNRLLQIASVKSKTQFLAEANKQFIPFLNGENTLKIDWIKKIITRLKTKKIAKFDFSFKRGKGISLDISTATIKLTDSLSLTAITDVTDIKKTQNALIESENKYRSLFENNITGLALGDQYGQILQANKALCAMFGYSKKEMMQLKHQNLAVQGKDDQSYKNFRAMVDGKVKKFSTTKQFIKKNGEIFYAIINVSALYNEQNQFMYSITSISDISELKHLEHELKEKQIELADKVVELEKYIESNLELENFAFIASHDLKSPTQTIINFSNLLTRTATKKLDDQEQQFLKYIVEGSKRLQNTINDLLNFSLANNNSLNIKKVNLKNLIKDVIKDLDSVIKNANATINIEGFPTYNRVDKGLYKGLFLNLISNAIKFQKTGNKATIKITCSKMASGYLFAVKDNGIGIQKKSQHKIFGIFKRLHNYTEYDGTGIGLALCKKVVEKHNGKIWVDSSKGKGATFYFTLPRNLK